MFLNFKFKITKVLLLLFVVSVFSPSLSAMAETVPDKDIVLETSVEQSSTVEKTENLYYSKLMREVRLIKEGKVDNTKEAKLQAINDLERFVEEEKTRLEKLGVDSKKQEKYFELLELQLTDVKSQTDTSLDEFEKVTEFYKETVLPLGESLDSVKESQFFDSTKDLRIENLEKPSKFYFDDEEIIIKSLKSLEVEPSIGEKLSQFFGVETAYAVDTQYLPVIEDIQEDDEVIISSSIRDLAHDLNNNPVEIFNYVRNNINYEPYFGAKKGSVGCLQERVCNDVDTASLTIALMRAAGIPARYKKGLAAIPVEQLQNLLGVDETKTAYYVFYANNVPVYTLSGSQAGVDIDLADFTYETHLVLDWVNVEIFYDYDERGANIPNIMNLSEVATTQDLQALFTDSDKKQWIPVDAAMKIYDRTQNEIVHDTANFDTMAFWLDFLQYQGDLSPIAKYIQDLLAQTGSDITLAQYQSTKEIQPRQFDILPSSLSYILSQGTPSGGDPILMETWSQLPNDHRYQVTLSLLHESDSSVVFSNTFFGSEINNKGVDLMYQGATPADEAVIESYGGIHATPAALVDIQPYFLTDSGRYEGASNVGIGESLILQFEYSVGGNLIYTDQKYSVAGNQEGIYMILSTVLDNPYFTDGLNDNSEILLEGNTGLAWKYIREVEEDSRLLAEALDYEYNLEFFRAVVTQNRVLAEVGGVPTTFDFEGLTIDASSYINDYSNRGNFREHQEDFRLLWGEQASYYEGQLFTDVAGLEGISTVKGLQYAYANPGTYTVHTIDSGNESVIDTLALSANTKANMHADVQAGNMIITPDKPVVRENFDGSLYISLDPGGTGTYAIGEQVANGGWSVDGMDIDTYCFDTTGDGVNDMCYRNYNVVKNNRIYMHEDKESGMLDCNIAQTDFDNIILYDPNWRNTYGFPCHVPEVPALQTYPLEYYGGSERLTYTISTNATRFERIGTENYDYWHKFSEVYELLDDFIQDNGLSGDTKFKFLPSIGTYITEVSDDTAVFYRPNKVGAIKGEVYMLSGEIFKKASGNEYEIMGELGYPIDIEKEADTSIAESEGKYQSFIGGNIYLNESQLSDEHYITLRVTYYVTGKILEFFNDSNNCHSNPTSCGTGGFFGFPTSDPRMNGNIIEQEFEEALLRYDTQTNQVTEIEQSEESRRYQNKEFGRRELEKVINGEISDAEAFARIMDYIAGRTSSNTDFVRDVSRLLFGADEVISFHGLAESMSEHMDEFQIGMNYKANEVFSDTGFEFKYNDSHYHSEGICQRVNAQGLTIPLYNSNQLVHAMLGFSGAYEHGKETADEKTIIHDTTPHFPTVLGTEARSIEDIKLGLTISVLGQKLRDGSISKEDAGDWVRNIIKNETESPIRSKADLAVECEKRVKFRLYERDKIGDIEATPMNLFNELSYSEDMQQIDCGGGITRYYQNYYVFDGHKGARAVLNGSNVYLVFREVLEDYDTGGGVCGPLGLPTAEFDDVTQSQTFEGGTININ